MATKHVPVQYRYLYHGEFVKAVMLYSLNPLRGIYEFPDGLILIRSHSSFVWDI